MMDLRDMQLLTALARHKHFARAAEACGISQPAFSARIRNLEETLQVSIVLRGNRFMGLTPEGEIVLKWAQQLLSDADGLRQEIEAAKGSLSGEVKIGVVPTALAFVASLPADLRKLHPGLSIQIISATSTEITRGLEDYSLDAGVSYLDEDHPSALASEFLYEESYELVAPPDMAPRTDGEATWAEAAKLPLCLLTKNMRNRRIIDETFASLGLSPDPIMETNAFTAALAQVASGTAATIAPQMLSIGLPIATDAVRLPLKDPVVKHPIGLFVANRNPIPPSITAFKKVITKGAR